MTVPTVYNLRYKVALNQATSFLWQQRIPSTLEF